MKKKLPGGIVQFEGPPFKKASAGGSGLRPGATQSKSNRVDTAPRDPAGTVRSGGHARGKVASQGPRSLGRKGG